MKKEEAQRIADNFFQRYEGSTDPIEILSTEYNHRLRDQIINASLTHPTLPSDEEIVDFAERVPGLNFDEEEGYIKGATWMRSIASARIAEMERELREAKQFISSVTEFAEGMKVLDGEALLVLKNTARRVLSDKPTQLPRK